MYSDRGGLQSYQVSRTVMHWAEIALMIFEFELGICIWVCNANPVSLSLSCSLLAVATTSYSHIPYNNYKSHSQKKFFTRRSRDKMDVKIRRQVALPSFFHTYLASKHITINTWCIENICLIRTSIYLPTPWLDRGFMKCAGFFKEPAILFSSISFVCTWIII